MAAEVDAEFYNRADAHIGLSNEQAKTVGRGMVSASMMFSVARYNAFVSAHGFDSGAAMKAARDEVVDYFLTEYRAMLEENVDDYVDNFERYMGKGPKTS